jgi:tRNA dimethylallyltransferase
VGTTASNKSELALSVARRCRHVEIVSIDSMCVYRGMDLATAKPNLAARAEVPHHLIDLVDPSEEFTVSRFQEAARGAVADIEGRGNVALLVGGTGLYLRAVVDELTLPGRWPELVAALENEADGPGGVAALHRRLEELDPTAATRMTPTNRRRVIRALEVTIGSGRLFSSFGLGLDFYPPSRFPLIGVRFDPEAVDRRIAQRFWAWLDGGLLEEVRALAARAEGLSRTARQAVGYRELLAHIEDGLPLSECVDAAIRRTRMLARRQWAWFRRDPRIGWVGGQAPEGPPGEACAEGGEQEPERVLSEALGCGPVGARLT